MKSLKDIKSNNIFDILRPKFKPFRAKHYKQRILWGQ